MKKGNWLKILQGILGIVFGLLIILWPLKTLFFITWIVGAYLLLHSIILIVYGFLEPKGEHRGLTILHGVIGLVIGVVIMSGTVTVLEILVFFFALWSLAAGIIEILEVVVFRDDDEDINTIHLFGGFFAILIAVFLFAYPMQAISIVQIILGIAVLAGGLEATIHALKERN